MNAQEKKDTLACTQNTLVDQQWNIINEYHKIFGLNKIDIKYLYQGSTLQINKVNTDALDLIAKRIGIDKRDLICTSFISYRKDGQNELSLSQLVQIFTVGDADDPNAPIPTLNKLFKNIHTWVHNEIELDEEDILKSKIIEDQNSELYDLYDFPPFENIIKPIHKNFIRVKTLEDVAKNYPPIVYSIVKEIAFDHDRQTALILTLTITEITTGMLSTLIYKRWDVMILIPTKCPNKNKMEKRQYENSWDYINALELIDTEREIQEWKNDQNTKFLIMNSISKTSPHHLNLLPMNSDIFRKPKVEVIVANKIKYWIQNVLLMSIQEIIEWIVRISLLIGTIIFFVIAILE